MVKEFNLSDKLHETQFCLEQYEKDKTHVGYAPLFVISVADVKEFIRKLKDVCPRCYGSRNIKPKRKCMECERIDKLAGEKLI